MTRLRARRDRDHTRTSSCCMLGNRERHGLEVRICYLLYELSINETDRYPRNKWGDDMLNDLAPVLTLVCEYMKIFIHSETIESFVEAN